MLSHVEAASPHAISAIIGFEATGISFLPCEATLPRVRIRLADPSTRRTLRIIPFPLLPGLLE